MQCYQSSIMVICVTQGEAHDGETNLGEWTTDAMSDDGDIVISVTTTADPITVKRELKFHPKINVEVNASQLVHVLVLTLTVLTLGLMVACRCLLVPMDTSKIPQRSSNAQGSKWFSKKARFAKSAPAHNQRK